MKVLVRKEAAETPKVTDILTIPMNGGVLRTLDGEIEATEGIVKSVGEGAIKSYLKVRRLRDNKYDGWDKDEMKEMRSFGKMLASYDDGDTVAPEINGLSVKVPIKTREREEIAVGDTVAFCETCRPAYLLNARATVTAIKGDKVTLAIDEGDLARLKRAGRDRFGAVTTAPVGIVEKVS